ncbi:phosphopantetheine-binding protein [Mycoplasmoides genitalium]|uniref:Acyl carrier protein homolog n=1 Tax=Mycoplasma genitalium (strain ATCC 33530 / DSM 19775 / NCTC 10195 / G37) TaxID=243273 RepID=ACPH_MYCGE|nr:phosphopantetheine-binding protein [Mycoplasmoides genitalium]P47529.1 RecName: Full=Acyl carrier protein homolog; Short=ACP [Mycoplasmoides genitalium G37]AAC71509.1 acyl carrier protein, putative [Mycoplasmoides genitalium G37]ABY79561.1 acyl carrier protein, putative [synthetic Mycoplasma genitalium JCVI-1.0]AFQ03120.1 acyl carrier protein [Mycoplasmoides genitalium M2321]
MQTHEILLKIKEIAKSKNFNLNLDEKTINQPLRELKIDSLDMFSIVVSLENEFGISFDDEKLMNLKNLADLVLEVKNLLAKKGV